MKIPYTTKLGLVFTLILSILGGCASVPQRVFKAPAPAVTRASKALFEDAFEAQEKGKYRKAISLWKQFLNAEPDSVQGHNNLGMVFYAEDRLSESINELETAWKLAPKNDIVLRNLSRSLQFQVALLKENREYERAIRHLQRLQEISKPEDFQKVQFMVEELEDRIYEQVQNANTVEKYRWYLKQYPTGINAEKARKKLAVLQDRQSSLIQSFEDREQVDNSGVLESIPEEDSFDSVDISEEDVSASQPVIAEEPVMEEPPATPEADRTSIEESPVMEEEAVGEVKQGTMPEPVAQVPAEVEPEKGQQAPDEEPSELTEIEPAPIKEPEARAPKKYQVVITLDNPDSSLRVRAEPNTKSPVLTGLKHGQMRSYVEENKGWFKIEYAPGKSGWVSKKFSRKLEPGTKKTEPQAQGFPAIRLAAAGS
ncbi:MAG: SH3 domain-containing protein [Candidatus Nitronauta litoralis]|uniref:SH3 domain-containing protein n=1 Tax=Candidatus Nitronauta litoralis TaxID=2705533 RepID=A0A7T0FZB1_9BACT|nr:MAG: SH3 domain-containing protein [Candidatus Nitronauta litoralis]